MKFIKLRDLKCIVSGGNYTYIYYKNRERDLVAKKLVDWEGILPERNFIRIHRSTIVNIDFVADVKKCPNYTQQVYIEGIEKPFFMSRRYAVKMKRKLPV